MSNVKNYFKDWSIFEKIWLGVSTILILALSIYWKDSLIGVVASLTGLWCVVLVAKNRISNYYIGIINVIAYAYVAYGWQYYGEVMLNMVYFLPMQFIGLYLWKKNMASKREVKVKIMNNKLRIIWTLISVVTIIGYGFILKTMGGNLPFIDSMSTVLSIIAMILMAFAYAEQWAIWIVVNIVSIVLWVSVMLKGGNDISILLMWTAYLVNSVYGLLNWMKMYKEQSGSTNV